MTTTPTHWIAGSRGITPVVILEAGTGGQDLSFVPPDPVVVRSVSDYFEFVASEGALFTDRGLAMEESHRLRDEEAHQAKVLLSRIERKEMLQAKEFIARVEQEEKNADLLPIDPEILDDCTLGSTHPVVVVGVSGSPNAETQSSEVPVEVVVAKKNKVTEDPTKPNTILAKIIHVVGRETLSFDDICKRLEANWGDIRRSSVSNVLSAHKNQFHVPERGIYSLRSKPPKDSAAVEADGASKKTVEKTSVPAAVVVTTDSVEPEAVQATSQDESTTVDAPEAEVEQVASAEPEPAKVKTSSTATWFGKPMTLLNPSRASYHDENHEVMLTEKLNGGAWTAEIHIQGLATWASGTSKDRMKARAQARANLNATVKMVNDQLDGLPGSLNSEFLK